MISLIDFVYPFQQNISEARFRGTYLVWDYISRYVHILASHPFMVHITFSKTKQQNKIK